MQVFELDKMTWFATAQNGVGYHSFAVSCEFICSVYFCPYALPSWWLNTA